MNQNDIVREHLIKLLDWQDAHVSFDVAVEGIPPPLQGVRPEGLPYSPWELLEHLRVTQKDILNFCQNQDYKAPKWPDEYWPKTTSPPEPNDWQKSVNAFRSDRRTLSEHGRDFVRRQADQRQADPDPRGALRRPLCRGLQ